MQPDPVEGNRPKLYGAQPADFYEFLFDAHGDMQKFPYGQVGRLYFIITHEFEVTFIALFLGPQLLFDMCSRVAIETIRRMPKHETIDGGGMVAFHEEAKELIPAIFSSIPQLALSIFICLHVLVSSDVFGRIYYVLAFSIACSTINVNLTLADLMNKLNYMKAFFLPATLERQVVRKMARLDAGERVATSDLGDAIRAALDARGDENTDPIGPALQAAAVRLLVLRGRDVRRRVLKAGAEVMPLLKDEGFVAVEMNEAQVGVVNKDDDDGSGSVTLEDAGKKLKAEELYTATQLRAAWYTALDLYTAGFSALELKDAKYSAAELLVAGYDATQLKAVGFTALELRNAGFDLKSLFTAGYLAAELLACGYLPIEMKDAGFNAKSLLDANVTPEALKAATYLAGDLRLAGCDIKACKLAGYGPQELYSGGFPVRELKSVGFTAGVLKNAGFLVVELVARAGANELESKLTAMLPPAFSATELKTAGYELNEMRAGGVPLSDLRNQGYGLTEMVDAGFLPFEFRAAGFKPAELKTAASSLFSVSDLKAAGYSASDMVKEGAYTLQELVGSASARTTKEGRVLELLGSIPRTARGSSSIFTAAQLREAGYSAKELRAVGFSWADLTKGQFTVADLKAAGASAKDQELAGLGADELAPHYSDADLALLPSKKFGTGGAKKKTWVSPSKRTQSPAKLSV